MKPTIQHPWRLGLFAVLSVLDLSLTYQLLADGGGTIYESNPFANAWLGKYGWSGLAFYKLLSMSVVVAVAAYVSCSRPVAGGRILTFACIAVAMVVSYSYSLRGTTYNRLIAHADNMPTPQELDRYLKQTAKYAADRERNRKLDSLRSKKVTSNGHPLEENSAPVSFSVADLNAADHQ